MLVHKLKPQAHIKVGDTKIFNLGERTCSIGIDSLDEIVLLRPEEGMSLEITVDKDAFDVVG